MTIGLAAIDDLGTLSPGAVRLATALSIASRIEPELVRAIRLEAFPGLDVGHESELWFSDWIGSRQPHAVALRPELLAPLRADLAVLLRSSGRDDPLRRLRDLIVKAHAGLPPTLRLEEEINWLSVTREPGHLDAIDASLEEALRALIDGGRGGIADWYAGALSRLPVEAQDTRTAWLLASVTAQRFPAAAPATAPVTLAATDVERIAARFAATSLGLAWDGPDLLISGRARDATVAVPVPGTDPRVVDVLIGDGSTTLLIGAEATVRVPAGGAPVRLRTAAGETFDVAGAEQLALVRRLAEEVGPAEFDAVLSLLPVTDILAEMVAASLGLAEVFEIHLSPGTHRRAGTAFSAVSRLLQDGLRHALPAFEQSPAPLIEFVADPAVRDGKFVVRVRGDGSWVKDDGDGRREVAIVRTIAWFVGRIAIQLTQVSAANSVIDPARHVVRRVLEAADAAAIRATRTASAGILPNLYEVGLGPNFPRSRVTDEALSDNLSRAVHQFAELRGCSVYGAQLAQVRLSGGDGTTVGFVDDSPPETPVPAISDWLEPVTYPRLISEDGRQILLAPGRAVIGRGDDAKIKIDDPWVAEQHAELTVQAEGVTVQRLSNANGILVNNRVVDRTELGDGDVIALGSGQFRFRSGGNHPPQRPGRSGSGAPSDDTVVFPSLPWMQLFSRDLQRRGYDVGEVNAFILRFQSWVAGGCTGSPAITAAEVRNTVFRSQIGGYDEKEVDEHLEVLEQFLRAREEG